MMRRCVVFPPALDLAPNLDRQSHPEERIKSMIRIRSKSERQLQPWAVLLPRSQSVCAPHDDCGCLDESELPSFLCEKLDSLDGSVPAFQGVDSGPAEYVHCLFSRL